MLEISRLCVLATTILVALALVTYVVVLFTASSRRVTTVRSGVLVGSGRLEEESEAVAPDRAAAGPARGVAWYGMWLVRLAALVLTVGLVTRTTHTGHAPFANQYEFAVAFAWGVLVAYVYFEARYHVKALALMVLPVAAALLLYADTVGSEAAPLVPALQNHLLLTLHVVTAVLAYGATGVAFGAAVLYLVKPYVRWRFIPSSDLLDEIGYRATVLTFPLLTIMIVLGAIWADIAWGTYWSWDPKETAALVTWLVYGAYLHARVVGSWRGNRAAWLLILGFAAVLFTYFGNLFFGGLHSYA